MEGFANLVSMLDYAVNTRRKRHITGGLLISAALLFGGCLVPSRNSSGASCPRSISPMPLQ